MSRFHPKYHRKNHHTNPTPGYPDSATDPLASQENPFEGDFWINGDIYVYGQALSATGGGGTVELATETTYGIVELATENEVFDPNHTGDQVARAKHLIPKKSGTALIFPDINGDYITENRGNGAIEFGIAPSLSSSGAIGDYSINFGTNGIVTGFLSTHFGAEGTISGDYGVHFGWEGNIVSGSNGSHFGYGGTVRGNNATHFGQEGDVNGTSCTHFGYGGKLDDGSGGMIYNASHFGASGTLIGWGSTHFGQMGTVSGDYGVHFGNGGTVSGDYGAHFGNNGNVSGQYAAHFGVNGVVAGQSAIHFGYAGDVSGDYSSHFGYAGIITGEYSNHFGRNGNISGNYSAHFGLDGNVISDKSIHFGHGGEVDLNTEVVFSSGSFTENGDAQQRLLTIKRLTQDPGAPTPQEMFIDGGSERLIIPDKTAWFFEINLVARSQDVQDEGAAFKFQGCIDRNFGTVGFIGSPVKTIFGRDIPSWDATVLADDTNKALVVEVTGEQFKTIRWVAGVKIVQVKSPASGGMS